MLVCLTVSVIKSQSAVAHSRSIGNRRKRCPKSRTVKCYRSLLSSIGTFCDHLACGLGPAQECLGRSKRHTGWVAEVEGKSRRLLQGLMKTATARDEAHPPKFVPEWHIIESSFNRAGWCWKGFRRDCWSTRSGSMCSTTQDHTVASSTTLSSCKDRGSSSRTGDLIGRGLVNHCGLRSSRHDSSPVGQAPGDTNQVSTNTSFWQSACHRQGKCVHARPGRPSSGIHVDALRARTVPLASPRPVHRARTSQKSYRCWQLPHRRDEPLPEC